MPTNLNPGHIRRRRELGRTIGHFFTSGRYEDRMLEVREVREHIRVNPLQTDQQALRAFQ